jgi:hypothetical protein
VQSLLSNSINSSSAWDEAVKQVEMDSSNRASSEQKSSNSVSYQYTKKTRILLESACEALSEF